MAKNENTKLTLKFEMLEMTHHYAENGIVRSDTMHLKYISRIFLYILWKWKCIYKHCISGNVMFSPHTFHDMFLLIETPVGSLN